jgi:rubrerythrin
LRFESPDLDRFLNETNPSNHRTRRTVARKAAYRKEIRKVSMIILYTCDECGLFVSRDEIDACPNCDSVIEQRALLIETVHKVVSDC